MNVPTKSLGIEPLLSKDLVIWPEYSQGVPGSITATGKVPDLTIKPVLLNHHNPVTDNLHIFTFEETVKVE